MRYNWQQADWPEFTYTLDEVEGQLFEFATRVGHISGLMRGMSEEMQVEAVIALMVLRPL